MIAKWSNAPFYMADVTQILSRIEHGDSAAAAELLSHLYEELRNLAAAKLAQEKPGQTLQATALVHEAYLRLLGPGRGVVSWNSRGHFFAAAAEAMRRILVENARRKKRVKHGGHSKRVGGEVLGIVVQADNDELLAVHEALDELEAVDSQAAELVKMHYFSGMTFPEAAAAMGVSARTAYRDWAFARAWLRRRLQADDALEE